MNNTLPTDPLVATFSIIGFDPNTGELGVAVQSKFFGVGAVVPWAKANVGAIATQSWANTEYGPKGLRLLEEGFSAEEVVELLIKHDEHRHLRQFAVIDANGNAAAYTGKDCFNWAGHVTGTYFSCQGNILVSEDTVKAMAEGFEQAEGSLAERLIEALDAGQNAGGDSRGKQSAALYVVKEKGGYGGFNDRFIDVRVDDHPEPIQELRRLYELHRIYFQSTDKAVLVKVEGDILVEIQDLLQKLDVYHGGPVDIYSDELREALRSFAHQENFEERWRDDDQIDIELLQFLRGRG